MNLPTVKKLFIPSKVPCNWDIRNVSKHNPVYNFDIASNGIDNGYSVVSDFSSNGNNDGYSGVSFLSIKSFCIATEHINLPVFEGTT